MMVSRQIVRRLNVLFAAAIVAALLACSGQSKADKLYEQGLLFQKNFKYNEAIAKYEQALKVEQEGKLAPKIGLRLMLADCCQAIGKPEQAIQYATEALGIEGIETSQATQAWLNIGQSRLTLAIQKRKAGADGKVQVDKENIAGAQKVIAEMRKLKPDSLDANMLEARIEQLSGETEKAELNFREILKKKPDHLAATQGLIEILLSRENYGEAEKLARDAMKGAQQPAPALVRQLATSLKGQKKYNDAYEAIYPSIEKDSDALQVANHLVAGDILLAQIEQLRGETAKPLDEQTSKTLNAELDKAIGRLQWLGTTMKGRYPSMAESHYIRGVSYDVRNNVDEAITEYQKAVNYSNGAKQYRIALAMAEIHKKQYELGRQELRNILREQPGDRETRMRIAQSYMMEGDNKSALEFLETLLNENPSDRQVAALVQRLKRRGEEGDQLLEDARATAQKGDEKAAAVMVQKAEKIFKEKVAKNPADTQALTRLAEISVGHNDLMSALVYTRQAAGVDKNLLELEAGILGRLGQTDAAIAIYERIVREKPDRWDMEVAAADLEARAGRFNDAIDRYERLRTAHPKEPRLAIAEAAVMVVQKPERALKFLADHEIEYGGSPEFQLACGRMQMQTERYDEALARLAKMVSDTKAEITRNQGSADPAVRKAAGQMRRRFAVYEAELALAQLFASQNESAIATIDGIRKDNPAELPPSSDEFEAIALARLGKAADARGALERLRAAKPQPASVPVVISLLEAARGDKQAALKTIESANQLTTDSVKLFRAMIETAPVEKLRKAAPELALGVALANQPIYRQPALRLVGAALTELPDEPFILWRKIDLLDNLDRHEESLAILDRLASRGADPNPILMVKAQTCMRMAQSARARGQVSGAAAAENKAIEVCQGILAKDPRNLAAMNYMAMIVQSQGKRDQANDIYSKLIEVDPANWQAYNNLAWNLVESDRADEAFALIEKALKLAPENAGVQDTAGVIALRRGEKDRGLRLLQEAALRSPNEPSIRLHLAQAFEAVGRTAEAVSQLETIVVAAPGFDQIQKAREQLKKLDPKSELLAGK